MRARLAALLAAALVPAGIAAQPVPADLATLPPVPTDHAPQRTAWGDPDLRAIYTLDRINTGRIAFVRPEQYGERFWLTDAEFAERLEAARRSDAAYSEENSRGTRGLEAWMRAEPFARRTSMLVSPADGKLPALTPGAEALRAAGRTSWFTEGRSYDWIDDFDTWDRCITRGFPASMLPFRYNNGVRIFQAPGFVVIHFEMLGDRIIPLASDRNPAAAIEIVARQQRGPLGGPDAGGRDQRHEDRRRGHARRVEARRLAAQRGDRSAVEQRDTSQR